MSDSVTTYRDPNIDLLRGFGLLLLIVAHTKAPIWLASIRTFDVPLMVLISAICYKPISNFFAYFVKRLKRIYIPVAIFLLVFLGIITISHLIIGSPTISGAQILGSFLLLNEPSIGYVWIMRVFLMMAIITPIIAPYIKKLSIARLSLIIAGIILLQHILVINEIKDSQIWNIVNQFVLYLTGYVIFVILGLKIRDINKRDIWLMIIITGICVFTFIIVHNFSFAPNIYKYPPHDLYLIYGLFACTILWLCVKYMSAFQILTRSKKSMKCFRYLSENSMWLYLWHIIPVYALNLNLGLPDIWILRFLFVLISSLFLNFIWHRITTLLPDNIQRVVA